MTFFYYVLRKTPPGTILFHFFSFILTKLRTLLMWQKRPLNHSLLPGHVPPFIRVLPLKCTKKKKQIKPFKTNLRNNAPTQSKTPGFITRGFLATNFFQLA